MSFIKVKLNTPSKEVKSLETMLLDHGAISVTLENNSSNNILEPAVGEQPLWDNIQLSALFEEDDFKKNIIEDIKTNIDQSVCNYEIEKLIEQDWERKCLDEYSPIYFGGDLWVCPSWRNPPNKSAVNLILDPGLAFGTGMHATTALCLEWLAKKELKDITMIDYGCGSGILAIAAVLLGAKRVICIDNDPQALTATKKNVKKNKVNETQFSYFSPQEYQEFIKKDTQTINLIMANILANPLIELAPKFKRTLSDGGYLILSGILRNQKKEVMGVYSDSINFLKHFMRDEWLILIGKKY